MSGASLVRNGAAAYDHYQEGKYWLAAGDLFNAGLDAEGVYSGVKGFMAPKVTPCGVPDGCFVADTLVIVPPTLSSELASTAAEAAPSLDVTGGRLYWVITAACAALSAVELARVLRRRRRQALDAAFADDLEGEATKDEEDSTDAPADWHNSADSGDDAELDFDSYFDTLAEDEALALHAI